MAGPDYLWEHIRSHVLARPCRALLDPALAGITVICGGRFGTALVEPDLALAQLVGSDRILAAKSAQSTAGLSFLHGRTRAGVCVVLRSRLGAFGSANGRADLPDGRILGHSMAITSSSTEALAERRPYSEPCRDAAWSSNQLGRETDRA